MPPFYKIKKKKKKAHVLKMDEKENTAEPRLIGRAVGDLFFVFIRERN